MEKNILSKEPYKGVRDFYPDEMKIRNYFWQVIRKVMNNYGFEEYDASILEESSMYRAKTGEEIVNEQTYNFVDRGGREVTLRPEMTPSVARMVARKRGELVFPLLWFNIGRRYRYERMQKGRLREFWQLDCDLFGKSGVEVDAMVLELPYRILEQFGAHENMFEIKINHRGLINYILEKYLKLDQDQVYKVTKLIDRKAKTKPDVFEDMLTNIVREKSVVLLELLEINDLDVLTKRIGETQVLSELVNIIDCLKRKGVSNVKYDPTLVRGFDYYTGVVFEVFDIDRSNPRSIFGGGRYDDLVGLFTDEKIGGVGFGMGDVVIMDFLRAKRLLPLDRDFREGIYICLTGENIRELADRVAVDLRSKQNRVLVDISGKKMGDQIKLADKKGFLEVVCLGEDELDSGKYKVRNLLTKKERECSI